MQTYFPPAHAATKFTCPYCSVVSALQWVGFNDDRWNNHDYDIERSTCTHCSKSCYWYKKQIVVPTVAPVEPAHEDLPEGCRQEYEEAREIVLKSPRAAAALVRLALQKLMSVLGEHGKNINDDVASLVAKGLPVEVQQALDICRVVGNNAVHPGEIDLNDSPEIAHSLFNMLNFIVEDRISRPKRVQALYGRLPDAARAAISRRDGEGK